MNFSGTGGGVFTNQHDERVHCGGGDGPTYYPAATWDYLQDKADDNGVGHLYD